MEITAASARIDALRSWRIIGDSKKARRGEGVAAGWRRTSSAGVNTTPTAVAGGGAGTNRSYVAASVLQGWKLELAV
jgi:hypothetical protein